MKTLKVIFLNILGIGTALAQTAVPAVNQATTTAATTAAPTLANHTPGANIMEMVWMIAVFMAIFYFLFIRPQAKRAKEQRKLMESLAKGDEVVTAAGIVGKITELQDDFVTLNVSPQVSISFQRAAITNILPKGTLKKLTE